MQTPQKSADLSVASLYPLVLGAAWSYDVDSGDGQPVLATTRVLRADATSADVVSGRAVLRYLIHPDGIQRATQPGYLLKAPVTLNASWQSGPDTAARVVSWHESVATPAGTLSECVVVQEDNASTGQHVSTTYCPGVGAARVVSEMRVRGQLLRVTARLRGFTTEPSN